MTCENVDEVLKEVRSMEGSQRYNVANLNSHRD